MQLLSLYVYFCVHAILTGPHKMMHSSWPYSSCLASFNWQIKGGHCNMSSVQEKQAFKRRNHIAETGMIFVMFYCVKAIWNIWSNFRCILLCFYCTALFQHDFNWLYNDVMAHDILTLVPKLMLNQFSYSLHFSWGNRWYNFFFLPSGCEKQGRKHTHAKQTGRAE